MAAALRGYKLVMTDPKETTNNTHTEGHRAGRPNDTEADRGQGSDVGGPAGGIETTLEDDLDQDSSVGDNATDSPARNPM
jgi:hypothetical protein